MSPPYAVELITCQFDHLTYGSLTISAVIPIFKVFLPKKTAEKRAQ